MAVAAGDNYTMELFADGTVTVLGDGSFGLDQTGDWTGIKAIAPGGDITPLGSGLTAPWQPWAGINRASAIWAVGPALRP